MSSDGMELIGGMLWAIATALAAVLVLQMAGAPFAIAAAYLGGRLNPFTAGAS